MARARQKTTKITRFQANFLRDLLLEDMEVTDLDENERRAAESLVDKMDVLLEKFDRDNGDEEEIE